MQSFLGSIKFVFTLANCCSAHIISVPLSFITSSPRTLSRDSRVHSSRDYHAPIHMRSICTASCELPHRVSYCSRLLLLACASTWLVDYLRRLYTATSSRVPTVCTVHSVVKSFSSFRILVSIKGPLGYEPNALTSAPIRTNFLCDMPKIALLEIG